MTWSSDLRQRKTGCGFNYQSLCCHILGIYKSETIVAFVSCLIVAVVLVLMGWR